MRQKDIFKSTKRMFSIHYVEIPKFQETGKIPNSSLEKWLLFFKTQNDKTLEDLQMADDLLNKAISEIEFVNLSPVDRRRYEAHLAALSDKASELSYAKNEGWQEGRQEGRQEGQQIGQRLGQHMAKQQMLNEFLKKRFSGLSVNIQKKDPHALGRTTGSAVRNDPGLP